MNKGKSKKKMNSYLKMVLIMLAGGVVGGIFGFVTSYTGENSIAAIGHGMNAFLLAVRDHTVLLECICGAICIMICEIHFGKMKRMGREWEARYRMQRMKNIMNCSIILKCPPAGG